MNFKSINRLWEACCQLFFPHNCIVCGTDQLYTGDGCCARCLSNLPLTGFLDRADNAVERIFWGRLDIRHAAATCFFSRQSIVQRMMHHLKYRSGKATGLQLGRWMGMQLQRCTWINEIDLLLPMPLHITRERARGYNQSALMCEGIAEATGLTIATNLLIRKEATRTQTKQHRDERWHNMQGVFAITDREALAGKHVLLVDDVITTGATLEAMGEKLLEVPALQLSIFCFAYTLPH
jgi:ComF family protein